MDELATGTELVELVGGPVDGRRLAIRSPPQSVIRVPVLPVMTAAAYEPDEPGELTIETLTYRRDTMNDQGVWRYRQS